MCRRLLVFRTAHLTRSCWQLQRFSSASSGRATASAAGCIRRVATRRMPRSARPIIGISAECFLNRDDMLGAGRSAVSWRLEGRLHGLGPVNRCWLLQECGSRFSGSLPQESDRGISKTPSTSCSGVKAPTRQLREQPFARSSSKLSLIRTGSGDSGSTRPSSVNGAFRKWRSLRSEISRSAISLERSFGMGCRKTACGRLQPVGGLQATDRKGRAESVQGPGYSATVAVALTELIDAALLAAASTTCPSDPGASPAAVVSVAGQAPITTYQGMRPSARKRRRIQRVQRTCPVGEAYQNFHHGRERNRCSSGRKSKSLCCRDVANWPRRRRSSTSQRCA